MLNIIKKLWIGLIFISEWFAKVLNTFVGLSKTFAIIIYGNPTFLLSFHRNIFSIQIIAVILQINSQYLHEEQFWQTKISSQTVWFWPLLLNISARLWHTSLCWSDCRSLPMRQLFWMIAKKSLWRRIALKTLLKPRWARTPFVAYI